MPHRKVRWRRLGAGKTQAGSSHPTRKDNDRWYSNLLDFFDIPDFGLGDLGTFILLIVVVLVAVALFWFLLIPALLLLMDVVVLLLLLVAGLFAHFVLRRPWEVEAFCTERRVIWLVAGWKRSRQTITEVEAGLRAGNMPPGSVG